MGEYLKPLRYRGQLYLIVGDPGPVPYQVVSLKVLSKNAKLIRVSAVLEGNPDGFETIVYTFSQVNRQLAITSRTKRINDYRYAPCRLDTAR